MNSYCSTSRQPNNNKRSCKFLSAIETVVSLVVLLLAFSSRKMLDILFEQSATASSTATATSQEPNLIDDSAETAPLGDGSKGDDTATPSPSSTTENNARGSIEENETSTTSTNKDATTSTHQQEEETPASPSSAEYEPILSAADPFLPLDDIAQLTLQDIAHIFDYALGQSEELFQAVPARTQTAFSAMQMAVQKSQQGIPTTTTTTRTTTTNDTTTTRVGSMDVFWFCAVMRIFAEWRIVRQVPDEGYKPYAFGMKLGRKDMVENVGKMEVAADHYIKDHHHHHHRKSPTLRDLLQYEIDTGINPLSQLPYLDNHSGAISLCWLRRQLQFQTQTFENIMSVPSQEFPSAVDALTGAYKTVYDHYHSWVIQNIFMLSFHAAPTEHFVYKYMNPHHLKQVQDELLLKKKSRDDTSTGSDTDESEEPPQPEPQPKLFGWGWGGNEDDKKSSDSGNDGEDYICQEMRRVGHEHILDYLKVVKPILDDIASLLEELNMDDPRKV